MALDFEEALNQYGFVGVLANNHPELKPLLQSAIQNEWDSARFERELANTAWYRRLSERRRAIALQESTDPATWNNTLLQKQNEVFIIARSMGLANVDSWGIAKLALENEWSEAVLRGWLADKGTFTKAAEGAFTGQAGEVENYVRNSWAQMGLPLSDASVAYHAKEVLAGRQTLGGLDNEARAMAKKAYPSFAEQIDSGLTMQEIASPYTQTMATTLEISGNDINLSDPYIKKALQGNEQGQSMPLWQFERTLKDDTRWQHTKQAKNETYAVLQQVGRDWGFA